MGTTKIEWCDKSWSPITGCSPVSDGCRNCYAKRMAYRLKGRYGYPKDDPFKVTFHPDRLDEPLHWRKPCRVFVCSMGDLFHEDVDGFWIGAILKTIEHCPRHTFMVLTKRPERMKTVFDLIDKGFKEYIQSPNWPYKNLWLGVSIEDQPTADERIPILLQIPAAHRFVSVEPMLGPVDISGSYWFVDAFSENPRHCSGIDWVVCGGETGPKARPLHPDWVRSLRDQSQVAGVPFFFKSWGEWLPDRKRIYENVRVQIFGDTVIHRVGKKKAGRLLDGKIWEER